MTSCTSCLDAVEADEGVELGQQLVERAGRAAAPRARAGRPRPSALGRPASPSGGVGRAVPAAGARRRPSPARWRGTSSMAASSVRDGSRSSGGHRVADVGAAGARSAAHGCRRRGRRPSASTSSSAEARSRSARRPTTQPGLADVARAWPGRVSVGMRCPNAATSAHSSSSVCRPSASMNAAGQVVRLDLDVGRRRAVVERRPRSSRAPRPRGPGRRRTPRTASSSAAEPPPSVLPRAPVTAGRATSATSWDRRACRSARRPGSRTARSTGRCRASTTRGRRPCPRCRSG